MWSLKTVSLFRKACTRLYAMYEPIDLVTGLQKRELLAHLAGNCDPFHIMPIKKGPGTLERPNLIPSAFDKRLVACQCSKEQFHVEYMWLHMGTAKRCGCGYWFLLCPVTPL